MNVGTFAAAVARHLPEGSQPVVVARHAERITIEASPGGPARQCGLSDDVIVTLGSEGRGAQVTMTGRLASRLDPRSTADVLTSMLTPAALLTSACPEVRPGRSCDWSGSWSACVRGWERHADAVSRRLRDGEVVTISLERRATEIGDVHHARRQIIRHRAIVRVVVPGPGDQGSGWEMSVPVKVGACRGGLATLRAARCHARLQAAANLVKRTAASGGGAARARRSTGERAVRGRVMLGPAAVAEALVRWSASARAVSGARPALAAVTGSKRDGAADRNLDLLLGAAAPPSWAIPAGRARRPSGGTCLLVSHVETWLSGDDRQSACAIVTGELQPGGRAVSVRYELRWRELEAAIRSVTRRGPARRTVLLAGRAISAPWLDLGSGRWRAARDEA